MSRNPSRIAILFTTNLKTIVATGISRNRLSHSLSRTYLTLRRCFFYQLVDKPQAPKGIRFYPTSTIISQEVMDDLTGNLSKLGLSDLTRYPNSNPELNPVDIYRSHITDQLASITGVDSSIIYPSLQWTQTLDKGDMVLPVPALRIKGKKPVDMAVEFAEKVNFRQSPKTAILPSGWMDTLLTSRILSSLNRL